MPAVITAAWDIPKRAVLGETVNLQLKVWDREASTDISTATVKMRVYDSAGTAALANQSVTPTGTTTLTIARNWDTSVASGDAAAPARGLYRVLCEVTYSSQVKTFTAYIELTAKPPP